MINYYLTIDGKVKEVGELVPGCWVNMVNPTNAEVEEIIKALNVDEDFIRAGLDEEEASHVEREVDQILIVVDAPLAKTENEHAMYTTIPMGVLLLEDHIVTVCLKETSVMKEFASGVIKNVETRHKTQFFLFIMLRIATRYLQYLKQIDKISLYVERQLHKSQKNKELIRLLDLEKSLVYFSTSLKANELTLEKILRGRIIKLYDEDQDLLEDVIIEIKQAIEMSNIYTSILSGTMDAFASIISNNLNIVMKVLTSITIMMAIPTMISSFYGMNVEGLPFPIFWVPLSFSLVLAALVGIILHKKGMF